MVQKIQSHPASLSPPSEGLRQEEQYTDFIATLFAALAHPTRLRMVALLTNRECTVNEMAAALGLLQPNASQHLAILSRAGVVKVAREGTAHRYGLRGPRIPRILRLADEFRSAHAAALQGRDEDAD